MRQLNSTKTFQHAMTIIILCCAFIIQELSVQAQEHPVISIDGALSDALNNNHEYKIAHNKLQQSREKVNAAWGQLMPAIESEASLLRQGADSGYMSLSDGQYDLKLVQLRFGINPGAFYHRLRQSQAGYRIAQEELKKVRQQVEFTVIKSYFDVILAAEMVNLRKNSIQVLRENLKDVQRMYQTGSVPKFELLQAQVQLKNQEAALLEAENTHRTALDMFNYQLGHDSIVYTISLDSVDRNSVMVPADESIIPELIDRAMKNRPEVLQVSLQKEAADQARKTHRSAYLWPSFTLSGYYAKTYMLPNPVNLDLGGGISPDLSQISGKEEWQDTWQVRFAATYRWGSLIPVDSEQALEREERERVKEAEQKLLQVQRLTGITIRSNFGKLTTASKTIRAQEENVATAREGLRIARESYKAGVIKNADMLDAELALTNAETGYIKALYEYFVSRASLNREIGVDSDSLIFGRNTHEVE